MILILSYLFTRYADLIQPVLTEMIWGIKKKKV